MAEYTDKIPARKICTSKFHEGPRWLLGVYFPARVTPNGNRLLQPWCYACSRMNMRVVKGMKERGVPYDPKQPPRHSDKRKADTLGSRARRRGLFDSRWMRAELKRRVAAGYSVEEIAQKMGVSAAMVRRVIKGSYTKSGKTYVLHRINIGFIEKYADAYDVPMRILTNSR